MTIYEAISIGVALVALVASGYSLRVSIPLQRLQRRELDEAQAQRKRADVRVRLLGPGRRARLHIENVGHGAARNVDILDMQGQKDNSSPLIVNDRSAKLPAPILRGGERVELIAALSMTTGLAFDMRWSWQDEDGTTQEREGRVSLQRT